MGPKERAKTRHRALVKVVLFIVRVQKSQKRKQSAQSNEQGGERKEVPFLRCSTVPTIPVLLPSSSSLTVDQDNASSYSIRRSPSNRSARDLSTWTKTGKYQSLLSVWDDNEEDFGQLSVKSALNAPYSRSRASSSVSRCSTNSKNSGGTDSLSSAAGLDENLEDAVEEEKQFTRFVDFVSMSKPYSLNGFVDLATTSSSQSGAKSKNVTVTCNSVMGDPRKLSKKLIRRGSLAETRDDRFAVRPSTSGAGNQTQRQKKDAGFIGRTLIRQQTADFERFRSPLHRCTSDENVAVAGANLFSEADISPPTAKKFVKRKSSADLLGALGDGGFSSFTLDRMSASTVGGVARMSTQMSKTEKKKLDKMKENMKQLQELFTAVEQDDIGKVRSILHHGDVDINGINADDLSLLDEATMLNHAEVALLLLKHGAQENQRMPSVAHRTKHLQAIIDSCEAKLTELMLVAAKQAPTAGSSATLIKSMEKQLSSLESRIHTLKKMRNNLENSGLPSQPKNVTVTVSSCTSLAVAFEPPDHQNNVIVTKYKVEWSQHEDFHESDESLCVNDLRRLEVTLANLAAGQAYFVRVSAGTFKGFGEPAKSAPPCSTPSSWRDVDQTLNRNAGRLEVITELFHELRKLKKTDLWERIAYTGDAALKKKKSSGGPLKNLFSSHAKFQRNPKRGVYLATVLYKEDKVLCTVDDCLPVVEVDETVPGTLGPDFQWFMKLSCSWEDMRSLHFDIDMANQSPSLMFRLKLLEAAAAMQAGLGTQDLGRLHSTPIIDNRGVTILVTVQFVQESKSVQGLAVKWLSMNKLLKKQASVQEKDQSSMDVLIGGLLNFLNFYESTYIPLDRGLYLGYVKLHTSINQISIVVPENLPSVLPFVFIRDNPHVSKEEWDWLRVVDTDRVKEARPNASQLAFHSALASAAKVLLNDLDVGDDQISSHRIYRLEVVEVHSDVSFILLVPSHDDVCLPPGQSRTMTSERKGCLALPVPMFEVAHLCTYQPDFIALYCRLSVFLEFYWIVLQQLHRQTLNEDEAKTYRQLLEILGGHQQRLEDVWKGTRWISSVVTAARDRQLRSSLPLSVLFSYPASDSIAESSVATFNIGSTAPASAPLSLNRHEHEPNGVRKRRSDQVIYENEAAVGSEPGTSAVYSVRQNRPRRVSSDDQSLIEDQGEENSDVGYHSDQSLEKLATAAAVATSEDTASTSSGRVAAASNPTYDFPENILQGVAYVNCGETKEQNDEKSISKSDNVEYLVNKLDIVQRTVLEKTSKLLEARYGKYDGAARGRLRSDELPSQEYGKRKQSSPSVQPYRTEIVVGETDSLSPEAFDVQFKAVPSTSLATVGRRLSHDYVNVPPVVTVTFPPKRKDGLFQPTASSAASDSEASCSSTSTASSSRSQLRCESNWIGMDERKRVVEEDLSVIDKLYAEAALRLPSSSTVPTPTPTSILQKASSPRPPSAASSTRSATSTSSDRSRSTVRVQSPQSGVLRVYAAYPCGLAKGTSVKLHVSPKTTAKEVVALVIRQLSKAVEMKGTKGPYYLDDELADFVLVAVIGARERCLRDDFPPLELQNPWCKGKLFVRRRNDLLAALEFGNEAKV